MRSMASRRMATPAVILRGSQGLAPPAITAKPLRRDDDYLTKERTVASIHKDISIDAAPNDVWDAVRDFGAVHTRLAPGFVTDARLDGDARIVTFANGNVAREVLVDCDDERRRLVYGIAK